LYLSNWSRDVAVLQKKFSIQGSFSVISSSILWVSE
jgi:hypothetical protein